MRPTAPNNEDKGLVVSSAAVMASITVSITTGLMPVAPARIGVVKGLAILRGVAIISFSEQGRYRSSFSAVYSLNSEVLNPASFYNVTFSLYPALFGRMKQ